MPEELSKAASGVETGLASVQSRASILLEWIKTIAYAVVLALFIRTFFLATFVIPTGSMEPTLRGAMHYGRGDKIIAIKFIYGFRIPFTDSKFLEMTEPKRGDVVVFRTKGISGLNQRKDYIKRVVGVGGEQLQIMPDNPRWNPGSDKVTRGGGHIYINGEPLEEPPTIAERTYYPAGAYGQGEINIPPDHFFMLGDNARNSRDSRFWGFVPRDNIVGKAVAIYWPPKRIGFVQ